MKSSSIEGEAEEIANSKKERRDLETNKKKTPPIFIEDVKKWPKLRKKLALRTAPRRFAKRFESSSTTANNKGRHKKSLVRRSGILHVQ